jgi:hypothetical protein
MAELFTPCQLTPAGNAVHSADETVLLTISSVATLDANKGPIFSENVLVVTTQRMILKTSSNTAMACPMDAILSYSRQGFFSTSKKILLECHDGKKFYLRFMSEGKDSFISTLEKYFEKRRRRGVAGGGVGGVGGPSSTAEAPVTIKTGIAGILKHEETERRNVQNLQKDALSDLENLEKHAGDVLAILEKYTAVLEREEASQDLTTSEAGELSQIEDILRNIGIVRYICNLSLFF